MKKILLHLLLACSISTFAQAEFPEGIKLGGNASTANSTKLLNQNPTTGTLDHINATSLPVSTATQTALNLKANIANPTFTGTVSGITKSMVGLGSVDNTSDLSKPISTATQTALNGKEPIIPTGTALQYIKGDKTLGTFPTVPTVDQSIIDGSTNAVSGNAVFDGLALKSNIGHTHVASQITDLSKASVGLGNVDNTSDLSKPLSTATINALATKAPISSVHNPVTIGTANGLSLSTQVLSLGLASSGVTGALSGTDWNTFNGKFNTPSGLTTNYLPKWNGSGFVDSTTRDLGDGIFELITPKGTSPVYRFTQNAWRTWDIGVKPSPSFPSFYIKDASSSIDRFIIADGGRVLINKTDDDLTNQLQVAGTITASPAVSPNQVVVKSQLDAVAGVSGTYTSNGINLVGFNNAFYTIKFIKVGRIVTCHLNGTCNASGSSGAFTFDLPSGFPRFSISTELVSPAIFQNTTNQIFNAYVKHENTTPNTQMNVVIPSGLSASQNHSFASSFAYYTN